MRREAFVAFICGLGLILILALAMLLSGCDEVLPTKPEDVKHPSSSPSTTYRRVAVVDGCTIYRIYGEGPTWFVRCPCGTSAEWREGKTSRDVEVGP